MKHRYSITWSLFVVVSSHSTAILDYGHRFLEIRSFYTSRWHLVSAAFTSLPSAFSCPDHLPCQHIRPVLAPVLCVTTAPWSMASVPSSASVPSPSLSPSLFFFFPRSPHGIVIYTSFFDVCVQLY